MRRRYAGSASVMLAGMAARLAGGSSHSGFRGPIGAIPPPLWDATSPPTGKASVSPHVARALRTLISVYCVYVNPDDGLKVSDCTGGTQAAPLRGGRGRLGENSARVS